MADQLGKHHWYRIIVSTVVLFVTLGFALVGIWLCWLQLALPRADTEPSTIKFGETVEVSSGIVGVLVLVVSFAFFVNAAKWFHGCFEAADVGPSASDLRDFLAKTSGKDIPRSELTTFLEK